MKLSIHMKSGKTLIQKNVANYKIKHLENEITSFSFLLEPKGHLTLVMGALDLSSIEAIERD